MSDVKLPLLKNPIKWTLFIIMEGYKDDKSFSLYKKKELWVTCTEVVTLDSRYLLVTELETLNNFCPSRFSQVCLDVRFWLNSKSEHTWKKSRQLFCRKSIHTLENDSGHIHMCVSRFAIWRKWKSGHTWKILTHLCLDWPILKSRL